MRLIRVGVAMAALWLYGCGSVANQIEEKAAVLPVTIVASGTQCNLGDRELNARWVVDEGDVAQLLERMDDGGITPAALDFARQRVLLISLGPKPTPGYGLDIAANAVIVDDTLKLEVTPTSPPPGAILVQMLTTPCMMLAMPASGYQWLALVEKASQETLLRLAAETY